MSLRHRARSVILRRAPFALAAALALACGGFDTPDLAHGAVTGRIPGATTGAYAYVLGAPEVLSPAAADGSFRLDGVPAGTPEIVLFDGAAGAERLPVEVKGASVSQLDPGRPLARASALVVAADPLDGKLPTGLAFSVEGTPLRQIDGQSGWAQLYPLPAGSLALVATQPGFQPARVEVALLEGVPGAVEVALSAAPPAEGGGCLSCGCGRDLACDGSDGQCQRCVSNADCPGGTCTAAGLCAYPSGGGWCSACTTDAECQGPSYVCANPSGGVLAGYCGQVCDGHDDCPSGQECRGDVCITPTSCLASIASYGAPCVEDRGCQRALRDGKCFPLDRDKRQAGYCSAKVQGGCPVGYAPDAESDYCARVPSWAPLPHPLPPGGEGRRNLFVGREDLL